MQRVMEAVREMKSSSAASCLRATGGFGRASPPDKEKEHELAGDGATGEGFRRLPLGLFRAGEKLELKHWWIGRKSTRQLWKTRRRHDGLLRMERRGIAQDEVGREDDGITQRRREEMCALFPAVWRVTVTATQKLHQSDTIYHLLNIGRVQKKKTARFAYRDWLMWRYRLFG